MSKALYYSEQPLKILKLSEDSIGDYFEAFPCNWDNFKRAADRCNFKRMVVSESLLAAHNLSVLGNGDQVVVLGHGFGSDQSMWKYVVPSLLSNNFRVVLYDLMGASTTDANNFSFKRYTSLQSFADDLLAILDELEIESCVYLNDTNYHGGFEQHDLDQMYANMKSNFRTWVSGFAPAALGAHIDNRAVQDFSRTLSSMRPDIAFSISQIIFQSDLRSILPQVTVPCHILQSMKDLAVPVEVAEYLNSNLGGWTSIRILQTEGHIPQLSSPELVIPVLLRCIED
ncbi:karrikin insensitive 2 receptor CA isoform X2 [Physcomitrium patens]|uniref:karrikin insensitive 2 receptor CA isoform X2 n=1 Tax=Physcomitrium patens TaxID=3218 RepID=UPI000D17C819|nr:probable esterase KAI2 isoform X2 [Physcomitrium patens]|eukprot:XP_024373001.1 probable esterase KAI2 isoform X2 [Physcomitrella patens]